jgi:hypothetical protein
MRANRSLMGLGLAFAAVLLLTPGCLERKETIRIDRDGSVRMRVELKGDPGDFATGDALPDEKAGWRVQEEVRTKDDGKEEQLRLAEQRFLPDEPLPDSYADPRGPNYETALQFPTTLTIERRPDGTYYHFKRVYRARPNAPYVYYQQLFEEKLKQFSGRSPAELTTDERREFVGLLRTIEGLKQAEYVRAGAAALEEEWPQHYGLLLRQALLDYFERQDLEPLLELLGMPQSEERDAEIDRLSKEFLDGIPAVLTEQLKKLRVPRAAMDTFFAALETEEARRAVTEDLNDEKWEVRVEMPGEIVAHNGHSLDGPAVEWIFDGKALMDRDQSVMVTSRLTRHSQHRGEGE